MGYSIEEIEDGIIATLQADATLAGYVKDFMPIPELDEEALKKLLKQFPCIGVISPDSKYDYKTNVQDETGLFMVLCFNRNLRSPVAPLRGGITGEKGLWDMVADCRRVLNNSKLGLTITKCIPRRRRLILAGSGWAAASLECEVTWRHRL